MRRQEQRWEVDLLDQMSIVGQRDTSLWQPIWKGKPVPFHRINIRHNVSNQTVFKSIQAGHERQRYRWPIQVKVSQRSKRSPVILPYIVVSNQTAQNPTVKTDETTTPLILLSHVRLYFRRDDSNRLSDMCFWLCHTTRILLSQMASCYDNNLRAWRSSGNWQASTLPNHCIRLAAKARYTESRITQGTIQAIHIHDHRIGRTFNISPIAFEYTKTSASVSEWRTYTMLSRSAGKSNCGNTLCACSPCNGAK